MKICQEVQLLCKIYLKIALKCELCSIFELFYIFKQTRPGKLIINRLHFNSILTGTATPNSHFCAIRSSITVQTCSLALIDRSQVHFVFISCERNTGTYLRLWLNYICIVSWKYVTLRNLHKPCAYRESTMVLIWKLQREGQPICSRVIIGLSLSSECPDCFQRCMTIQAFERVCRDYYQA